MIDYGILDYMRRNQKMSIENQDYILKIVKVAQYLETYWYMDQSEDINGTVKVCAPMWNRKVGDYTQKRVYNYKMYYEGLIEHFKDDLVGYNDEI
jgi:hypothetical protein